MGFPEFDRPHDQEPPKPDGTPEVAWRRLAGWAGTCGAVPFGMALWLPVFWITGKTARPGERRWS